MQPGNLVGPVVVAIGVIIAAIVFAVVSTLLQTADSGVELRLTRLEEALSEESGERARLAAEVATLRTDMARLREDLSLLANRAPATGRADTPGVSGATMDLPDEDFENPPETEALTEAMLLAKSRFNKGITQPRNRTMMEILGPPRDSYSADCQPVTNAGLKALMETRTVGPIKVTMLRQAIDSLERVMQRLQQSDPDIYAKVGTAGAFCARFIRGSTTSVSNHSWGTAIDLTLEGQLDPFADGGTQFGLLILAEYFNDEGWFWGAAYSREDSMHFEVGEETLRRWKSEGKL
ncbi:MAG: M15 family metallopeptidase [Paracoccaceae bacterium]|nr:M15 family metallopeptidase [Paracoccaceae bacterium]MDH5528876.1 M15 family metallopeptidase [Paracoccaceae bacterium]